MGQGASAKEGGGDKKEQEDQRGGWLDAKQRAALAVFCAEGGEAHLPASLGRAVGRALEGTAGPARVKRLEGLLRELCEEKGELEAVRRLVGEEERQGEVAKVCAESFFAMLEEESERGPCSEEEAREIAESDVASLSGAEVGRLLLWRCCGTGEPSRGASGGLGGRVARWRLQTRVAPRAGWSRLYHSAADGAGAAAFGRAVACYGAATVLLVRSAQGDVVGLLSESEWKSGARFFGTGRCKLFTVRPELRVFDTTGIASNYCYFHLPSSKAHLSGTVADGIGMGGQLEGFRLHVDADLKRGEASVFDSTYESGQLVPLAAALDPTNTDVVQFEVESVEVWGLGGPEAMAEKKVREQHEMKEALKRRQVNRKVALGVDDEDGATDMWLVQMAGAHQSYVKEANHNDT